ncbi:phage tail protein [Brevibacillus dissolubilis]|uniref:phage tail protein n=1 Tax=Brevibacillus dissolubilis TaxID=1844116 RepID=UPI00111705E0|nr:hypothetical protein [Brevibacillus dissolubilis]
MATLKALDMSNIEKSLKSSLGYADQFNRILTAGVSTTAKERERSMKRMLRELTKLERTLTVTVEMKPVADPTAIQKAGEATAQTVQQAQQAQTINPSRRKRRTFATTMYEPGQRLNQGMNYAKVLAKDKAGRLKTGSVELAKKAVDQTKLLAKQAKAGGHNLAVKAGQGAIDLVAKGVNSLIDFRNFFEKEYAQKNFLPAPKLWKKWEPKVKLPDLKPIPDKLDPLDPNAEPTWFQRMKAKLTAPPNPNAKPSRLQRMKSKLVGPRGFLTRKAYNWGILGPQNLARKGGMLEQMGVTGRDGMITKTRSFFRDVTRPRKDQAGKQMGFFSRVSRAVSKRTDRMGLTGKSGFTGRLSEKIFTLRGGERAKKAAAPTEAGKAVAAACACKPPDKPDKKPKTMMEEATGHLTSMMGWLKSLGAAPSQLFDKTIKAAAVLEEQTSRMASRMKETNQSLDPSKQIAGVQIEQNAQEFMGWLRQEAVKNPFSVNDMTEGGLSAWSLAEGDMGQAKKIMQLAADMAAAIGGKLKDALSALEEAKDGKKFDKLKPFGVKMSEDVFKGIGFQGLIDKESIEFGGSAEQVGQSSLKLWESINEGMSVALQDSGVKALERLKPHLQKLQKWLTESGGGFEKLRDFMIQAFAVILDYAMPVLDRVGDVFKWLIDNFDMLKPIIVGVAAAFSSLFVILKVVGLVTTLIGAFGKGGAVIMALTNPIMWIVAAIGLLAAAWVNNWGGIREKTAAVIDYLMPYFDQMVAFFQEKFAIVSAWFQDRIPKAMEVFSRAWTYIMPIAVGALSFLWEAVKATFGGIWGIVSGVFEAIWGIGTAVFDALVGVVEAFILLFEEGFASAAIKLGETFYNLFASVLGSVWELVTDIAMSIYEFLDNLVGGLFEGILDYQKAKPKGEEMRKKMDAEKKAKLEADIIQASATPGPQETLQKKIADISGKGTGSLFTIPQVQTQTQTQTAQQELLYTPALYSVAPSASVNPPLEPKLEPQLQRKLQPKRQGIPTILAGDRTEVNPLLNPRKQPSKLDVTPFSQGETQQMLSSAGSTSSQVNHTKSVQIAQLVGEMHVHEGVDVQKVMDEMVRRLEQDLNTEADGSYEC